METQVDEKPQTENDRVKSLIAEILEFCRENPARAAELMTLEVEENPFAE